MDAAQQQQFEQLLSLTEQMRNHAQEKQWEEVISLEAERESLMRGAFEVAVKAEDSAWVKTLIEKVLSVSQEITELAGEEKQEVSQSLKNMRKRQQATSAYLQHTR